MHSPVHKFNSFTVNGKLIYIVLSQLFSVSNLRSRIAVYRSYTENIKHKIKCFENKSDISLLLYCTINYKKIFEENTANAHFIIFIYLYLYSYNRRQFPLHCLFSRHSLH